MLSLSKTHPEWHVILKNAFAKMDTNYLNEIVTNHDWLPGLEQVLSAFSLPISQTRFILFGESPYPRKTSANGFAFWDNAVDSLWSKDGLSKPVNKATSLRNLIKMLLLAKGDITTDVSQKAIADIDKSAMIQTAKDLFSNMMKKGILLLNASLVFRENQVPKDARNWLPFMQSVLEQISQMHPSIQLILLGKIAKNIPKTDLTVRLLAEHPYNISFITNPAVLDFFRPLDLLRYHD